MGVQHDSNAAPGRRGEGGAAGRGQQHATRAPVELPPRARVRLGAPALALGFGVVIGWYVHPPGDAPRGDAPSRAVASPSSAGTIALEAGSSAAAATAAAPTASGSLGGDLAPRIARARRLMSARAWERPPGENVRQALSELAEEGGSDPRVVELRQEAAERLLADAVALRYAGRLDVAAERVRFALALVPELLGARDFLTDLQQPAADGTARGSAGEPLTPRPTHVPPTPPGPAPAIPDSPDPFRAR